MTEIEWYSLLYFITTGVDAVFMSAPHPRFITLIF